MIDQTSPLRTLALKSAAWYGASRIWSQAVSWAVTIVLARWLTPQDYGLFAIALGLLVFLELLQEFGIGTVIVQNRDLSAQQLNALFWLLAVVSFGATILVVLTSDFVAPFYAEPRLGRALKLLSLVFLVNSVGTVPYSLLTKAIDLRRRSLAEAVGTATSAVTALLLAYLGYGVWALIVGHLARAVSRNALLWAFAGWLPTLDAAFLTLRAPLAFGLRMATAGVIANLSLPVNTMILARLQGAHSVGLYTMAESVVEAPHRVSTAIVNQVSFPVFSKLQDEPARLSTYFLAISKCLAIVALPVEVGLVLVAPDVVPWVLGEQWVEMIPVLQILGFEALVVVLTLTASPLLTARGRARLFLGRSMLSLLVQVVATLVGALFSVTAVAIARLMASLPLRLSLLLPALRELDLSFATYLRNMLAPILATGVMAAAVATVRHVLMPDALRPEALVLSVTTGALSYTITLLCLDPGLVRDFRAMARDLFSASEHP
jgi:O-antigen/teichoic acid export membrane protein